MSAAIAASAKATERSPLAKAMAMPSSATAQTRPVIAPASGWQSSTCSPSSGRTLVSRKAPVAEISRRAAGAAPPPTSMHIRRRRHGDAMPDGPLRMRTALISPLPGTANKAVAAKIPLSTREAPIFSGQGGPPLGGDGEAGLATQRGAGAVGGGAVRERPGLEADQIAGPDEGGL